MVSCCDNRYFLLSLLNASIASAITAITGRKIMLFLNFMARGSIIFFFIFRAKIHLSPLFFLFKVRIFAVFYDKMWKNELFLLFFEKKIGNACVVKKYILLLHRQTRETNSSVAQSVRAPDC